MLIIPIVESLPGDEKASAMSLLHSFYCWGHVAVVLLSTLFFFACRYKSLVLSSHNLVTRARGKYISVFKGAAEKNS